MQLSSFFWIRSTGFPFELMDCLNVISSSITLDHHELLLENIERAETEIRQIISGEAKTSVDKCERAIAEGIAINRKKLPSSIRENRDFNAFCDSRENLLEKLWISHEQLDIEFQAELVQSRQSLIQILSSNKIREAIFLSNTEALQRIDSLVQSGIETVNSRTRQRIRLAWSYVQRLCAKNDTASFFGPIAWGKFSSVDGPAVSVSISNEPWLTTRKTFFEHWVILRLMDKIYHDPELQQHIPIVLSPGCQIINSVLYYPIGKSLILGALETELLENIQQQSQSSSPLDIVQRLTIYGYPDTDIFPVIQLLTQKKVLNRTFEVAPGELEPIKKLINIISGMNAPKESAKRWLSLLQNLESCRLKFEVGDLAVRQSVLDNIKQQLSEADIDLSRAQGDMYVGRYPFYEDCARNLTMEQGGNLLKDIKQKFKPMMDIYNWLVGAVAIKLHDYYSEWWKNLSVRNDTASVDFLSFFSLINNEAVEARIANELRQHLQHCWSDIAKPYGDVDEINLTVDNFETLLDKLHTYEPRASQVKVLGREIHSPDYMLEASSLEKLQQGDYHIIVGEVHPAVHTVSQPVAQPFCPYVDEIFQEVQDLLSPKTIVIADTPESYQRSHIDWIDVPALQQLVLPKGGGHVSFDKKINAGACQVVMKNDTLFIHYNKTGMKQELLTLMPTAIHRICFNLAGDAIGKNITQRLSFDNVVIKRRSWNISHEEFPNNNNPGEDVSSFLDWRRWAKNYGLPRYIFAKIKSEPKPIYVDFHNPFALDMLAGLAKKKEAIFVSEMRPAPDNLWLEDDNGRYCSEFRTSYINT